uniref:DNA-directed RNA polymerase subunit beta'' n=1 Tax=Parasitaxus usta TaxID=56899 RepID=A0A5J6CE25_9CONI|nr:RNA polymerase beta' subunit [Parasitaxus usta]QEQ14275.1 RNA polymerase beta' subunit [Parasitaxus usta]
MTKPLFKVPFYNKVMDRTVMKRLIRRFINHFGMTYTSHILDQLKTSGFQQATDAAISLGIDDLLTAPSKGWLVQDAEQQDFVSEKDHYYGNVHAVEKLRQLIEIWHATSEYLRQEMNPHFRRTDPFNPVHMMSFSGARGSTSQVHQLVGMRGLVSDPQGKIIDLPIQRNFREGLSLTEYIISCYGARKGVVDTAVRTADAGYLTRRLVEVVQHIVVRRADCGTIQGILVSLSRGREKIKNKIVLQTQTLIGRVLADDIYINGRCIATRNQGIGAKLADQLRNFQTQPTYIYIRTPFTCKNISSICQLCYGGSTTHDNLIELGEAVGIIAGQSIGEPGTQLTLRTFHTGGVFTGDITEQVRAPFNGKIKLNENLIFPTRTRHGHPAYICYSNLSVTLVDDHDKVQNLAIPSQSLLLVRNDQYVESEQVIAEVRAITSPFKETVKKHIYSDLKGEMHWSTHVCHAPINDSNVHFIRKTTHFWILSGGMYGSVVVPFSFHKDQDQVDVQLLFDKRLSKCSVDQTIHESVDSNRSEEEKKEQILSYFQTDRMISNKHRDSIYIYPSILSEDSNSKVKARKKTTVVKRKKETNRFIVPLRCDKEWGKRTISCPDLILRIPRKRKGMLQRNNVFAVLNDPQYRIDSSEGPRGALGGHSICEKSNYIENRINRAYASIISVRTNKKVIRMLQISLKKRPLFNRAKKDNITSSQFMFHNRLDYTNPSCSDDKSKLLNKHEGTIHSLSNQNKKGKSFMVLSPSDYLQIAISNENKSFDTVKKSIRDNRIIKVTELSGLLGHLHTIAKRFSYSHFITYNKVMLKKRLISDNYFHTFQAPKCYFMDENAGIYKFDPCRNIISNLFNSDWCSSLSYFTENTFPVVSLGQFICESEYISGDEPFPKSGQIIAVHEESLVIRLAKPYLGTGGATVHSRYGEIIYEGDTLITLLYERLKTDDIIQGLPKIEQLPEARSTNSVSKNLKKNVQNWNRDMEQILGRLWGSFISARITMEQSQIQLVNQIQRVYRSQGVQISDKHIEIIVRQMTSKVLIVENSENQNFEYGMGHVFLPGELVGLSRAQRMNRALEEAIDYRIILLGITKASLNTQSFLSEASFQVTVRVLAKAALQGRIDWLKGLKQNVILGGVIPVGTGFNRFGKRINFDPRTGNHKLFSNKLKDPLFHHKKLSVFFH